MRVVVLVVLALLFVGFGTWFTFQKRLEAERKRREAYSASGAPKPDVHAAVERDLEFIAQPITSLDALDGGILAVGLGPMARSFVIHPKFSPEPDTLTAFAKAAHAAGKKVYATAWIRDRSPKDPKTESKVEWPFVILRLADTPDPRAARAK